VVLLDGLDEIADERDRKKVVTWVRRQIERYPANSFVVTSRPHGYLSNPIPNADVLQVQRFTAEQISEFLQHWSYAVECRTRGRSGRHVRTAAVRQADDLLRKLRSGPAMYELAANPLLLTMIANVHRYRGALPRSRAALYAEMCDALIHRRQEAKNLNDATGLEGPKKERVMRHLALHMMRERTRDVLVSDAQTAIRRPLHQVTGERELTPTLFLDESRKSGMLVGGEHGVCGFAHLTFQEYLAAAHIHEQPAEHLHLLTEGVNDPWWRETTLLWAAGSDATPVIDACLASGTIDALTLAFDCADEALEIDPDTRGQLNKLLSAPDLPDHDDKRARERHRLIAAVTASRSLREVVWQGTTTVCAQPVTGDLYNLFLLHEKANGRHIPALRSREGLTGRSPGVGMWADDANRFVSWLNTLFDDGPTYRLPTPDELAHPDTALIPVLTHHTVWTSDGHRTVLHQADRVPWPYTPTQDQITGYPGVLLEHIRPALRLAQVPRTSPERDLHHLLGYTHVFAPLLSADPLDRPGSEHVMAVDRARDLLNVIDLALDLEVDLDGMGADSTKLDRAFDIAISLNAALIHELVLIRELNLALGRDDLRYQGNRGHADALDRALGRVRALAADFAYARKARPRVSPLIRGRVRDLGHDLAALCDIDLTHEHDRARDRARNHARDLGRASTAERGRNLPLRALHHARNLDRALALALELDLTPSPNLARDQGIATARDLTRDLALELEQRDASEFDFDHVRSFARARARARDLDRALTRDLARTLAYDLARSLGAPYQDLLPTMVAASAPLLRSWPASLTDTQAGDGQAQNSFTRFLAKALATSTAGTTRTAEDPGSVIRHVLRRLPIGSEVMTLGEQVAALIGPVLNRTAPADQSALAVACAGLLAMIVMLRAQEERLAGQLAQTLGTLIAMTDETRTTGNQVLLLVRT
jgi:hypothetical protein